MTSTLCKQGNISGLGEYIDYIFTKHRMKCFESAEVFYHNLVCGAEVEGHRKCLARTVGGSCHIDLTLVVEIQKNPQIGDNKSLNVCGK